jgi:FkbM family methyltransferase
MSSLARPQGIVASVLPDGSSIRLLSSRDSLSSRLFWQGFSREPEALPLWANMAKRAKVIVDVGANIGVYSLTAAASNPRAQLFCFEPVELVAAQLTQNLLLNRAKHAVCIRAAVGATDGLVPIFYRPHAVEQVASTYPDHRMSWDEGPWVCDYVEQVTIDQFVQEAALESVDLVKVDVEKGEPAVLEGMAETISRYRPHIFCEVFPQEWVEADTFARLEALLEPAGYRYYLLTPEGAIVRDRLEGHEKYWNQLFTAWSPEEVAVAAAGRV